MKRLPTIRSWSRPLWSAAARRRFVLRRSRFFSAHDLSSQPKWLRHDGKAVLGYPASGSHRTPKGFTLIEMLVAVTLVLLMMVMFAEIFQLAGASVTKQRALSDNDQNARTFVTVIRADLDKLIFRTTVPFFAGELPTSPGTPFNTRQGFFYISCNNNGHNGTPQDGSDDVLQFTADVRVNLRNADESPNYGRAVQLTGLPAPLTLTLADLLANPNQPEMDDGQFDRNAAGGSRAAEIAYWMRGGKLYRRVMLLRDPIPASGIDLDNGGQPTFSEDFNRNRVLDTGEDVFPTPPNGILDTQVDWFDPSLPAPFLFQGEFWRDFDYSAHRMPGTLAFMLSLPTNARFNGLEYLLNDQGVLPHSPSPYIYSLGQTWNRFGYNSEIVAGSNANGLPREFSYTTAPGFFGRFTQEETSHADFNYPQFLSPPMTGNGNPMDAAPAGNALMDANNDGVVDQYAGGARTGVDLLLSHVHEFRVELWDDRLNDFAPVGHERSAGGIDGDYHINRQLNGTYGPLGAPTYAQKPAPYPPLVTLLASGQRFANVFDTWHPNFNRNANIEDADGDGILDPGEDLNGNGSLDPILGDEPDRPPYRPVTIDPTGVSGPTYSNPSGNSLWWSPITPFPYQVGDVVFPRREDLNGNGYLDPGEDGSNGFPIDGMLQETKRVFLGDVDANGDGDVLDPGDIDLNGNGTLEPATPIGVITEDIDQDGVLDAGEDGAFGLPANGVLDPDRFNLRRPLYPTGLTFAYRCVRAGTSGLDPAIPGGPSILHEPNRGAWSTTPGRIIHGWTEDVNNNGVLDPGEVDVINPGVIDREPDWIVEYNVRPLRAIRITVRFEHPSSKQMRQVTIVHSLRDTTSVP